MWEPGCMHHGYMHHENLHRIYVVIFVGHTKLGFLYIIFVRYVTMKIEERGEGR